MKAISVASAGFCTPYWPRFSRDPKSTDVSDADLPGHPLLDGAPAWMKRRLTRLSRMALESAFECMDRLGPDSVEADIVFATANGEINIIGKIMSDLLGPRQRVSPQDFQNSVYNAAAGYLAIATGRTSPSNTVARGNITFEYGLLEAACRMANNGGDVLLVAGDEAVRTPWAAPKHASLDVCGSIWLSFKDAGKLATILEIRHAKFGELEEAFEIERILAKEYCAEVLHDHGAVSGPSSFERVRNPSSGILHFVRILKKCPPPHRIVFSRSDRDRDMIAVVLDMSD